MYIRCAVAYDGTDYRGFQYQPNAPSIQEELEVALGKIVTLQSRIVGAGRTDTGVHARGQVVAVHVSWRHDVAMLQRAWNAKLPPSIHVYNVCEALPDFHPRFSALHRTYSYTVRHLTSDVNRVRSPLTDRYALFERRQLDVDTMQRAARFLIGEHDFATFGQPTQGESTTRHLLLAEWAISSSQAELYAGLCDEEPTRTLVFTVRASGFLRRMVRNLVGSLLEVGRGRWSSEHVAYILKQKDRALSAAPVPPQGLVLERVDYPHVQIR